MCVQVVQQSCSPRHELGGGKERVKRRFTVLQQLFRGELPLQAELVYKNLTRFERFLAHLFAFDVPRELLAIAGSNVLADNRVKAFSVQEQAIHVCAHLEI